MAAIRSRENKTEALLRKKMHAMGFRYRKYPRNVYGSPDIVFVRQRIAVFVDGDYWHGRVLREQGPEYLRSSLKTVNRDFWLAKFARNVRRDDEVTERLKADGWEVLRYWESEVKADLEGIAKEISRKLRNR